MRVYIKYKDIPNRNDIKSNFIGILKITNGGIKYGR